MGQYGGNTALLERLNILLKFHAFFFFQNIEFVPQFINALLDRVIHFYRLTPFALGFSRPFIGGIETHLASQTGDR